MKRLVSFVTVSYLVLIAAAGAFAQTYRDNSEKNWWIVGTVTGNRVHEEVITLKLVPLKTGDYEAASITSTNRFGQYAFSNPGSGLPPSAYRLVIFKAGQRIMEVGLDRVKPGGRVPPININW